ncbi:MAG: NAD-dependent epimerase/dehydratase family protein [Achromobacter pulmonis]|uniref:dTDP-4-oxo-6-deoxy-D-allose reductase n=1 Tax=Achromobacter pulmonis TaxID=1389932 RepID=A0A6S7D2C9_9BURK|nr:NAD(P)-dependent oxidoreductase [Achromobacter pulmonis]CAB3650594.1 dTDP-4-oxo-6-deoxy-D-allose reductase [Achromobacter pulmonis]CAB3872504.1 dTDP-4-oxo-6-deoxy-D-allose reductase [Achromobacter pulmonis]
MKSPDSNLTSGRQRILVTGATGFVGRNLVQQLACEHEVLILSRREVPAFTQLGARCVLADLGVNADLISVLPSGGIDRIIHLAQSDGYRDFPGSALDMFQVNVASTAALLDYAAKTGVKGFVLASTGSVYEPYTKPMDEALAQAPESHYARTKLAAELLAQSYSKLFNVCALRLFFPYGPQQTGRLVPNLFQRVQAGEKVLLDGDAGGMVFTPTHIDDVVTILRTAAISGWQGAVNVATPEALSIKDVAQAIGRIIGREPSFERTGKAGQMTIVPPIAVLSALMPDFRFKPFEDGARFFGQA